MTIIATIPFSGFYGSIHSEECEREIEYNIDYFACETGENIPQELVDILNDSVDWSSVYLDYAREYAASFLQWLSLDGKFESMSSPREYNFATDRIFVEMTRDDIVRIWKGVDKSELTAMCKARFTSCDGFISGYSSDWRTWGKLSDWDHNQVGTLLLCFAECEQGCDFDQYAEIELMESYMSNGGLSNAMHESDKYIRVMRVFDYLIDRSKRAIKTLDQWHAARRAENRPFTDTPLGAYM